MVKTVNYNFTVIYKLLIFFIFITGKCTAKEQKTVRLVPLSSINQSKTKPNATVMIHGKPVPVHIMKKNDNPNRTIAKIPTHQLLKMIPNKVYAANV